MLKSDVYITLEENDRHLLIRGELALLEKLLHALRNSHDESHSHLCGNGDMQQQGEAEKA